MFIHISILLHKKASHADIEYHKIKIDNIQLDWLFVFQLIGDESFNSHV